MSDQIVTEPFSAGYEFVHGVEIQTVDDEEAIMDADMYAALDAQFEGRLIGHIDGLHYYFKPTRSIPASTVAVPDINHHNPETLLIQK
jgi:hypothetical protein